MLFAPTIRLSAHINGAAIFLTCQVLVSSLCCAPHAKNEFKNAQKEKSSTTDIAPVH
jgi:hypothetical protein